ncbi:hypothetical protein [Rhodococcus sp. SORGH_AS_0301]|uniref:hypothetical protein n=1 Tax=Rhodococcus sp. SORGH_AS_0301 TaxID=3041780 RepID=UPI0027809D72|nr:hypothetical protein [Rhodococcus sp. SORGH_AS_0301]MDQ1178566.1 hypothetical protein [Rhodococcus sp. SORGH_AS_0301]
MTTQHLGRQAVRAAAVTEAALVLQDRVDVLLDRLTDRVLGTPRAGSDRWLHDFRHPSATPQERAHVRSAILTAAGFAPHPPRTGTGSRRNRRGDPAQLTMF